MKPSVLRAGLVSTALFALVGCSDVTAPGEEPEQLETSEFELTPGAPSLSPPRITSLTATDAVMGFPSTVRAIGTNLATVSWDFGDSAFPQMVSGLTPRVVFRRAGLLPVRVTAKNTAGLSTTVTMNLKVGGVVTETKVPSGSYPFANGSQVRLVTRADGRRVFAQIARRLADGTLPVELGVERADGTFETSLLRAPGIDSARDLRVAVGADNVPQLLVASDTRVSYCRVPLSGAVCVDLGAWSGNFDLALRSDDRPVVSVCRGRWLAPDIGGLRLFVANTRTPNTLADFGTEVLVDTRAYRLPVDLGAEHALVLIGNRPVIIGNNGLWPGRYPDGSTIAPVQVYEALSESPRSAADFAIRDVETAHPALAGVAARVVGTRLVVAGGAGGRLAVYSAPTSALAGGFRKALGDELAPSDPAATRYRLSLSSVGVQPVVSFVDRLGKSGLVIGVDNQPSESAHLVRLPAFDVSARYYTAVVGRATGPAGLSLLVHRSHGGLELLTAR
jgi:hypothetical protein